MQSAQSSTHRRLLAVLDQSSTPLTGRQVATAAGMSPTTVNRALRELEAAHLASSTTRGRATLWRGTPATADALAEQVPRAPQAFKRRALLLTALPLELSAVKAQLPGGQVVREPTGARVFATQLIGDAITWDIRAISTGPGNTTAAAAAAHNFEGFTPDLVLFVGVAGGLKPGDLNFGDVVIVNRAYNASAGKEVIADDGTSTFLSRPVSEPISFPLDELAQQVAATMNLSASIAVGAVASTEAVLADVTGPQYKRVRATLNDCSIVDMESYGVYAAGRRLQVSALSVRGVSDFVDGKTPDADKDRQPQAAANAAKVAVQLLREAHPDDVRPSPQQRLEHVEPSDDGHPATVTKLEHDALPATTQPWYELLLEEHQDRANAARLEVLGWPSGAIATHASRIVDRPPSWLRSDEAGHAWAMVASAADLAGSGVASRAYLEAARRASAAGQPHIAGYHRISAHLAQRTPKGADNDAHMKALLGELSELDLTDAPEADVFRSVLSGGLRSDDGTWTDAIDATQDALAYFGHPPASGSKPRRARDTVASVPSWTPTPATRRLPEAVRSLIGGRIALQAATLLLYEDEGLAALQTADLAVRLLPASGSPKLRRAQALLSTLHSPMGGAVLGRASDVLTEVQELSLQAHAIMTEWGADGAEALALAGRALVEAGDPRAALRLLLPPPEGTASAQEATGDEVSRILVGAALMVGDQQLALKAAERIENASESLLLRASALQGSPGMKNECRTTFRQALRTRAGNRTVLERALLGLARTGEPLHKVDPALPPGPKSERPPTAPAAPADPVPDKGLGAHDSEPSSREILQSALAELRGVNPQLADLVVGEAALRHGDASRALMIARRYRDTVHGIELLADAHEALGEPLKATTALWDYGAKTGDVAAQLEAMSRAGRHGAFDILIRYSETVIRDYTGEAQRVARRARIRAASMDNDWRTVDTQAAALLQDESERLDARVSGSKTSEATQLRWMRVEAQYRMRRFQVGFDTLTKPALLAVTSREQALLGLVTIYRLVEEQQALDGDVVDWVLGLASEWIDDEEVCRQAIGILMFSGGDDDLARVVRAREVIERYFAVHGDDAKIRQISLNGDIDEETGEAPDGYFDPLFEELRRGAHERDELHRTLEREVWLGRLPWAMAVTLLDRTYAGTLIQGATGLHVVGSPALPVTSPTTTATATEALTAGPVVADTSALILGPALGVGRRDLLSVFDHVYFPETLLDDMFRARTDLARRSDLTLGWDVRADRARRDVAPPEEVERWATSAEELCDDVPLLTIHAIGSAQDSKYGLSALDLADEMGLPLWVDDAAMRALAAQRGVGSFTTFDLIAALRESGTPISLPTSQDVNQAALAAHIVDIDLPRPWWQLAREDAWQPNSGTAVAISRPAAWQDVLTSFGQFRDLIDVLGRQPEDVATVEVVAGWTAHAAKGLAWALQPGARATMVSNLLAWVLLQRDPIISSRRIVEGSLQGPSTSDRSPEAGKLVSLAYALIVNVGEQAFPNADAVRELTSTLASTVRSVADAPTTMRIMLEALREIDEPSTRDKAIKALLMYPPLPTPEDDSPTTD